MSYISERIIDSIDNYSCTYMRADIDVMHGINFFSDCAYDLCVFEWTGSSVVGF